MQWLGGAAGAVCRGRAALVMLDVETSGLDPHHDRLLAVAAIACEWTGSISA